MGLLREAADALLEDLPANLELTEQRKHRLEIIKAWLETSANTDFDLETMILGHQSLDIGCGQGDMIEMFAAMLQHAGNANSKVLGIDPGPLTYGAPINLGQAQQMLRDGPFGSYLDFHQATAPQFVEQHPKGTYRTAYLAHSLYYFPSAATVYETFLALRQAGVETLLLAEWDLSISHPDALPHLLATLLQTVWLLPNGNIRTVLDSEEYIQLAEKAGWQLVDRRTIQPGPELEDGKWETSIALKLANRSMGELDVMGEENETEPRLKALRAQHTALQKSLIGRKDNIHCMDVFTAVFKARST